MRKSWVLVVVFLLGGIDIGDSTGKGYDHLLAHA